MILELMMAAFMAVQEPPPGAGASVPVPSLVAPVRFEMELGAGADGRPVCRVAINGAQSGEESGENIFCLLFMSEQGNEAIGRIPPDVSVTASITMALDDEEVPPRSLVDRGQLVFDSSARVGVDRGGRISNCETLGTQLSGPLAGMQGTADPGMPALCELPGLSDEIMFRAAPDGPATRAGLLRMEMFLRIGISRSTV